MQLIDATDLDYKTINEMIRKTNDTCTITKCCGQRFIAAGMTNKNITIQGIPGNALGAYLNDAIITVKANAQDAVGDTMNDGKILIYGNIGDAAGYAMRGGKIYVQGDAGYRAGIHMKAYKSKIPVMIIGGSAGSFLGEYQAGGIMIVLGLNTKSKRIVGNFPCTGMHGGKIYLRGNYNKMDLPKQVTAKVATLDDMKEIKEYLCEYCFDLGQDLETILHAPFTVITPDSKNPYQQMYVAN